MRDRVESGDRAARWRASRVVAVLQLLYRLIVETAFWKRKKRLRWGLSRSRLGNLPLFEAFFNKFLYRRVPVLDPEHWGLLSIYNFFHYLISVGLRCRCDFRSSLKVQIDIVHVKVEVLSVLTSTASRIFNWDSCFPDLLNTTERVGAWG